MTPRSISQIDFNDLIVSRRANNQKREGPDDAFMFLHRLTDPMTEEIGGRLGLYLLLLRRNCTEACGRDGLAHWAGCGVEIHVPISTETTAIKPRSSFSQVQIILNTAAIRE